jgi:hypothetical protein
LSQRAMGGKHLIRAFQHHRKLGAFLGTDVIGRLRPKDAFPHYSVWTIVRRVW